MIQPGLFDTPILKPSELSQILELRDRGAQFFDNHSGGKDSQTQTIYLKSIIPASQLTVIHADLPGMDWAGTWDHVQYSAGDLECLQVVATKTFLEMVERRQMFPSSSTRQCTSDLKRGPIEKGIRHWIKDNNHSGLVVNCTGIRSQESKNREKGIDKKHYNKTGEALTMKFDKNNSLAGREWYNWYPIFNMDLAEVWNTISEAGERRHWAYDLGMSRLSCMCCIMANKSDLQVSLKENPEIFATLAALETNIDHTMFGYTTSKNKVKTFHPVPLLDHIKGRNND